MWFDGEEGGGRYVWMWSLVYCNKEASELVKLTWVSDLVLGAGDERGVIL